MSLLRARRKMQKTFMPVVGLFVAIFIASIFLSFNYGNVDSIAQAGGGRNLLATIDGKDVPLDQFRRSVSRLADQFGRPGPETLAQLPRYAYEDLVREYAMAAAAAANGINVSGGDAVAEARRQVDEILKRQGEGATESEIREARQFLMSSVDTEQIRRRLAGERLQEKLTQEARTLEVKVAHILVKPQGRTDEEARKLAESYARLARSGSDFGKLAREHSEDEGSKVKDGVVGWASANPESPPPPKKDARDKKPAAATPPREPAQSFAMEFTAASLRLKPGEVSNPVRSSFGYHVIKALETREYEPQDPEVTKDPKKRQEAIDNYRMTVGSRIANGLIEEWKSRLKVTPHSEWLKGFLAEEEANARLMSVASGGKPVPAAERLAPAIEHYTAALKGGGPEGGPGLAYKLAKLLDEAGQPEKAVEVLEKEIRPGSDSELHFALGEALLKVKTRSRTDALESFQKALKRAGSNTVLLDKLPEKFKELGRQDLAEEARRKSALIVAQREEARKKQEEEARKAEVARKAAEAAKKTADKAAAASSGETVQEITVKTGDIDPKTGKPKIISVTPSTPAGQKPAGEKPATKPAGQGDTKSAPAGK